MNDNDMDKLLNELRDLPVPEQKFSSTEEFKQKFFARAAKIQKPNRLRFWVKTGAAAAILLAALTAVIQSRIYLFHETTSSTAGSAVRIAVDDFASGGSEYCKSSDIIQKERCCSPVKAKMASPMCYAPLMESPAPATRPVFNTAEYKHVGEQPFYETKNRPLSTFGADVDTAGYTNIRQYLLNGSRSFPAGAVRVEEFINYFRYDYPRPAGEEKFAVNFEMTAAPWAPKHRLLLVGVQAKEIAADKLPPANYVFLVDDSGSMYGEMGLVKEAMSMLARNLRPQDRVSIVTYGGAVRTLADGISGSKKEQIIATLEKLTAGGYTSGGAGIQTAYKLAHKHFIKGGSNRIVLITDGDFNVGVSSEAELVEMVKKERQSAIYLTAIGVGGHDNYKDNKLKMIANQGNGNYVYLDSMLEAKKVMLREFFGRMFTVAKDVKFQLEFNPDRVKCYRQLGYELRQLNDRDFNDDSKDAGEVGAGQQVTVLYELVMADSPETGGIDPLKYQKQQSTGSPELLTLKMRWQEPEGNRPGVKREFVLKEQPPAAANIHWAACVAEFAQILRNSEYKGAADISTLRRRAQPFLGNDPDGSRAEFLTLIRNAAEQLQDK